MNWIELNWIELNWIELNWTGLNWIELDGIELDWLDWIEMNWTELIVTSSNCPDTTAKHGELGDRDGVAKSSPMSSDGNKSMIQDETPDEGASDGRHEGKRRADDDCGRSNDEPLRQLESNARGFSIGRNGGAHVFFVDARWPSRFGEVNSIETLPKSRLDGSSSRTRTRL